VEVQLALSQNPAAVEKGNQAAKIVFNSSNRDSLLKAIALYTEAIQLDSTYSQAYFYKAFYMSELGNREEAFHVFLSSEKYSLSSYMFYQFKGMLLENRKEMGLARDAYLKALSLCETEMERHLTSGNFVNWMSIKTLLDDRRPSMEEINRTLRRYGHPTLEDEPAKGLILPSDTIINMEIVRFYNRPEFDKKEMLKSAW
jgi:tetratricopeptide (TPR) repeat protein